MGPLWLLNNINIAESFFISPICPTRSNTIVSEKYLQTKLFKNWKQTVGAVTHTMVKGISPVNKAVGLVYSGQHGVTRKLIPKVI